MTVDARGAAGAPAARQSTLRDHNLGIVLRTLARHGELTRAGIAQRTGLTRATVSRLSQELIDGQLVAELAHAGSTGPGRPGTPLKLSSERFAGVGLEINVDYVAGRALALDGSVVAEFREEYEASYSDPAEALAHLTPHIERLSKELAGHTIVGTILGIPGLVDVTSGTVLIAPNLGWRNVRPADILGIDVEVMNDVNAQGYASAYASPGRSHDNRTFLYVSGDVGIGSALVFDGELEHGRHGWAGEIGHVTIEPGGPLCSCGSRGCLERYAGKRAILESAGLPPSVPPGVLLALLEDGDAGARDAVDRAGWALGIAISDAVNMLDVSDVILGTGLTPLLPWLRDPIMTQLEWRPLASEFTTCTVQAAPADATPCSTGGALLSLNRLLETPSAYR